jgi:thiol-disulfide isomerase/thioredoxin
MLRLPAAASLPASLLLSNCAGLPPALAGSRPVGAEVDVEAPDLSGRAVRVAEARGRVRIVDFWTSRCEPCVEALAALEELASGGGGDPAVYAVSVDEDRTRLDAFLAAHPLRLAVLLDRGGQRHAAPLAIVQLPTTLLVDRGGTVCFVHRGWRAGDGDLTRREVRRLLTGPASRAAAP